MCLIHLLLRKLKTTVNGCLVMIQDISSPQVSSIVYLDSPAGVGLSYSGNEADYVTGDIKTASDSHTFLLKV